MITLLTVAQEPPVIEKVWNLVDWLIVQCQLSPTLSVLVNVLGALLCMLLPYLLGSINPAIVYSKLVHGDDIRNHGSKNAGATNMLRTYGKKAAVITLLCDFAKAIIAVWIGRLIWEVNGAALAGFFVIFGHMFPLYYRFQGGKGVACLAMVVLTISPISFLFLLLIFLVCVIGTRMVSFASVMSAFLYPLILQAFANNGLNVAMAVITTCFVVYMHRGNLKRIYAGEESKLDFSKLFKRKKDENK